MKYHNEGAIEPPGKLELGQQCTRSSVEINEVMPGREAGMPEGGLRDLAAAQDGGNHAHAVAGVVRDAILVGLVGNRLCLAVQASATKGS